MKLSQINEMFDNVTLGSDVHIDTAIDGSYVYTKKIGSELYRVNAVNVAMDAMSDEFLEEFEDINNSMDIDVLKEDIVNKIGGVWSIDLEGPNSFQATGKGNFADVYGFLLASLQDMITNHGINSLTFSGMEPGMDMIYTRFIKSFKRSGNPALQFHEVGEDLWMSDRGLTLLDHDLAEYLRDKTTQYDSERRNMLMISRVTKLNQKRYNNLVNKTIRFNDEPWRIIAVSRSMPGVMGQLITNNNSEQKKRQTFSPEMIQQFEDWL